MDVLGSGGRRKGPKELSAAEIRALKLRYVESSLEPSTLRNYASSAEGYEQFCVERGVAPWPLKMDLVEDYTVLIIYSEHYGTALNAWSGIKFFHLKRNYPDVTKSHVLKLLHVKAQKMMARNGTKLRDPMDIAYIRRFCIYRPKSLTVRQHTVFAALIAVGVRALLRPGELAKLKACHVKFYAKFMVIDLVTRKNAKQRAAPLYIDRSTSGSRACPVMLMERLFAMRRREAGWSEDALVFTTDRGAPMTYTIMGNVVRQVMAGDQSSLKLSAHSIRITGACLMMMAGFDTLEIQVMGDWKSNIFLRYLRTLALAGKKATDRMGF